MSTTSILNTKMKTFFVQAPVGIPTGDGGLEIPNRVFLGGIATETTELELENFFQVYGTIKDVRIVTDRYTGENKGYGFVTFDANEDINKLISKRTISMNGKKLRVRKAIRRNGSQFIDCSVESPHVQPAEQYIMVTQPQAAPNAQAPSYVTQVTYHQPCANYSLPVTTYPSQLAAAPPPPQSPAQQQHSPIQQQQPPLQTLYYLPVMNSSPMQVPLMQQMQQMTM